MERQKSGQDRSSLDPTRARNQLCSTTLTDVKD